MSTMTYKGYAAKMEYSDEDGCFVGHIAGIKDVVGFHAESVEELREAFEEAVDDYLATCEKTGLTEAADMVRLEDSFPEYAKNSFGAALRGARCREGVTQRQLAELTGIPQRHISELENGKRRMERDWARKLSEALHVSDYRIFL